jgi:hypothetical protein
MLRCAASFVIAAYFYVRLMPQDFFASGRVAQSHPFGAVPGLRALPANFLRNHPIFEFFTGSSQMASIRKYQGTIFRLSLVFLLWLSAACSHQFPKITVQELPSYEVLFQQTKGWTGGDGIFSVKLDSNRVLWLFGDTFIGEVKGGRHVNARLVNNTLAIQTGLDPEKGNVKFYYKQTAEGKPAAFVHPSDGIGWFWPYQGLRTQDGLFLFLVQVDFSEGPPGFNFKPIASWLIHVSNPDDPPEQWKLNPKKIPWSRENRLIGSAVMVEKDDCFIYGTNEKSISGFSEKELFLARVPVNQLNEFNQWRFLSRGAWVSDAEQADPFLKNMANEFSVSYHPALNRYILLYTQDTYSEYIVFRLANNPWGPWSEPIRVYRCPEATWDPRIFCYAAKGHPELSWSPEELIVTYTTNSTDFDLIESDTRFYHPRFLKIRFQ